MIKAHPVKAIPIKARPVLAIQRLVRAIRVKARPVRAILVKARPVRAIQVKERLVRAIRVKARLVRAILDKTSTYRDRKALWAQSARAEITTTRSSENDRGSGWKNKLAFAGFFPKYICPYCYIGGKPATSRAIIRRSA
jgi:hypothetical protein